MYGKIAGLNGDFSCKLFQIAVNMKAPDVTQPATTPPGDQTRESAVKRLARECGFELVGIAAAEPLPEIAWYREWLRRGCHAGMTYLEGRGAELRADPRALLRSAKSIICLGKVYNTPGPYSIDYRAAGRFWVSRYAWGQDYHYLLRRDLRRLARRLSTSFEEPLEWRGCVDSAPLLERAYARRAGLGWIGKNSCIINQKTGSWVFLAELLVSWELAPDAPVAERCGSCRRCLEACPTGAIIRSDFPGGPAYTVDSRRCISYLTIEHRGALPLGAKISLRRNLFGCDICQEVCPWNRKAPLSGEPGFQPANFAPEAAELLRLDEAEFKQRFRRTPLARAGRAGIRRNLGALLDHDCSQLE